MRRIGILSPVAVLVVLAAVALFAMTASPSLDFGGDDGTLSVSDLNPVHPLKTLDAVSAGVVDLTPDSEARAANPFDCLAANIFRSLTFPYLFNYWNFIISRVC